MKFRKKPVIIEAVQWTGHNREAIESFVGKRLKTFCPPSKREHDVDHTPEDYVIIIPTLEGEMKAIQFDWIIQGVHGEFYPCKNEIFIKTYEKVEE